LSEEFGDAGDALSKVSWLVKRDKKLIAYTSVFESYDHSVEDAQDTVVETNRFNYVLDLSVGKIDTMNSNQEALKDVFTAFDN
jgi:ribose 5-phosphate isomerase